MWCRDTQYYEASHCFPLLACCLILFHKSHNLLIAAYTPCMLLHFVGSTVPIFSTKKPQTLKDEGVPAEFEPL